MRVLFSCRVRLGHLEGKHLLVLATGRRLDLAVAVAERIDVVFKGRHDRIRVAKIDDVDRPLGQDAGILFALFSAIAAFCCLKYSLQGS